MYFLFSFSFFQVDSVQPERVEMKNKDKSYKRKNTAQFPSNYKLIFIYFGRQIFLAILFDDNTIRIVVMGGGGDRDQNLNNDLGFQFRWRYGRE